VQPFCVVQYIYTSQILKITTTFNFMKSITSVISKAVISLLAAAVVISFFTLPAQQASAMGNCPYLSRTLSLGMRDATTNGEVSALQQFLAQDPSLFPDGEVTGYFGPMTQRAVERFQARMGIINYGNAASTGYGSVGAQTRAALAQACDFSSPSQGGLTLSDIQRILVTTDSENDSATVEVTMKSSSDVSFEIEYTTKTKAIRAVGDALEEEYSFDFSSFSSDSRRDSKLKKLVRFEEVEEEDSDNGDLTIDDIRDITVTTQSSDAYAEVEVDLRDEDDFDFDIVKESRDEMVREIAEKLEDRYDFDFSEFDSDRERDSEVEDEIKWRDEVLNPSSIVYVLSDVKSVIRLVSPAAIADAPTTYVITLKSGRIVRVITAGNMTAVMFEKVFRDSGYIGDINALVAKSTPPNPKGPFVLADVVSIKQIKASEIGCPADVLTISTYTITLKDGTTRTVKHQTTKLDTIAKTTPAAFNGLFTAVGYTGDVAALIAKAVITQSTKICEPSRAGLFVLADVKSITVVDNRASDRNAVYTITLNNNAVRTVSIAARNTAGMTADAFKKAGYTGDVAALIAKVTLAVVTTPYVLTDVKTITSKYVDPRPTSIDDEYTLYTVTLKNGTMRTFKRGFSGPGVFERSVRATGYTGDIPKLIALASSVSYGIADVLTITVDASKAVYDGPSVYTIVLKSGKIVTVSACSRCTADMLKKAFTDSGYTGDVAKLTAMAVKIVPAALYTLVVKNSVTNTAVATFNRPTSCTPYSIAWGDGVITGSPRVALGTVCSKVIDPESATHVYAKAGSYTVKLTIGDQVATAIVKVGGAVVTPYALADVKSVTTKYVDPSFSIADDEYTLYTITLKNAKVHTVKRASRGSATVFETAVKVTGYTGDVALLLRMTFLQPSVRGASTSDIEEILSDVELQIAVLQAQLEVEGVQ
jgi:hypothetical protein